MLTSCHRGDVQVLGLRDDGRDVAGSAINTGFGEASGALPDVDVIDPNKEGVAAVGLVPDQGRSRCLPDVRPRRSSLLLCAPASSSSTALRPSMFIRVCGQRLRPPKYFSKYPRMHADSWCSRWRWLLCISSANLIREAGEHDWEGETPDCGSCGRARVCQPNANALCLPFV